jgi:hypothetical protein
VFYLFEPMNGSYDECFGEFGEFKKNEEKKKKKKKKKKKTSHPH